MSDRNKPAKTPKEVQICAFDTPRDRRFAHSAKGFGGVLHVFDAHWHGIRSASGCAPGHTLTISHKAEPDAPMLRHAAGLVHRHGITHVIFQGYSWTANLLAHALRAEFGPGLGLFAITHVTAAQFENGFEMEMQYAIADARRKGILNRVASVKPGFSAVDPDCWDQVIVNYAPAIDPALRPATHDGAAVFVPVENSWRKNLHTNLIAAHGLEQVETIHAVNWPTGLDKMMGLTKVRVSPFRSGLELFSFMGSVAALMNVTLAECQPMTALEAMVMGTPCLTGPLHIDEFADDPLTGLTQVASPDNALMIREALARLLDARASDPGAMTQMIDAHLEARHRLATERYAAFLGL